MDDLNAQPVPTFQRIVEQISQNVADSIHNAHQYLKYNDFLKDECCIIQINNTDELCFARVLVVARAYIHRKDRNAEHKWESKE
uniref:Uncharacterized protein n=1 Tax=Romanomermis culicivorax TaxID=13658 RepID=A0A915L874_ROMCU